MHGVINMRQKPLKIFVPMKRLRDTGGPSNFARKFKLGLEKQGHEVFFQFRKDYDILLVIVQCNPLYLFHAKINKRRIVQRLDGVYYWSVAKWKYPLLNLPPMVIHKFFSNFTIYQSRYSQYCADKFLSRRKDEEYSIIYNGVDTNLFNSVGKNIPDLRDNADQKIFITASQFRRTDQLLPIIEALEIYRKKFNTNFKFLVIGDFNREVRDAPQKFGHLEYIRFLGKLKNEDLPKYERSSDVFLFTHLNPPCPNNIIEAMSCGLPICGVADGAMKELTEPEKNSLLIESEGEAFWKRRNYNYEKFAINLNKILCNSTSFSKRSREIVEERFSLEKMINDYLKIF